MVTIVMCMVIYIYYVVYKTLIVFVTKCATNLTYINNYIIIVISINKFYNLLPMRSSIIFTPRC